MRDKYMKNKWQLNPQEKVFPIITKNGWVDAIGFIFKIDEFEFGVFPLDDSGILPFAKTLLGHNQFFGTTLHFSELTTGRSFKKVLMDENVVEKADNKDAFIEMVNQTIEDEIIPLFERTKDAMPKAINESIECNKAFGEKPAIRDYEGDIMENAQAILDMGDRK